MGHADTEHGKVHPATATDPVPKAAATQKRCVCPVDPGIHGRQEATTGSNLKFEIRELHPHQLNVAGAEEGAIHVREYENSASCATPEMHGKMSAGL